MSLAGLPANTIRFTRSVTDSAGAPVAGAGTGVEVLGYPAVTATTGADGGFTLDGAPSGNPYTLKISKSGYFHVHTHSMTSALSFATPTPYVMCTPDEAAASARTWGSAPRSGAWIGTTAAPSPSRRCRR